MTLVEISAQQATDFVKRWHYSRTCIPGMIRLGWEQDGRLVGVNVYDSGNHAMRCGAFGPEHYRHVIHHHRMAMTDDAPKFSESRFIGASLRYLRVHRPDLWALVTYADLCQYHDGTIYRATNAVFTGVRAKGNIKFRRPDGSLVATQTLTGTWPERREQARQNGWEEIRCRGKCRYVYLLGTAKQRRSRPAFRWPVLPYSDIPEVLI